MKILVIGSTGKTGQKLLEQLSKTNHTVSGLVRSVEQGSLVRCFNADVVLGDLEGNVDELFKGFDAIIFVAGSRGKNIHGVDYQGVVKAVDAAVKSRIKRFLYIGSINVGKEPRQFIQELESFYQARGIPAPERLLANTKEASYHNYVRVKQQAEEHIIGSGLNYTILRAGLLTEEIGSGMISATEGSLRAFGEISRENVAAAFIEVLENKDTYRRIYTILDGGVPISRAFSV